MYTHHINILGPLAITALTSAAAHPKTTNAAQEAYFAVGDNVKAYKSAVGPGGFGKFLPSQGKSSTNGQAHNFTISIPLNTDTSEQIGMTLWAPSPGMDNGVATAIVSVSPRIVACWQTC